MFFKKNLAWQDLIIKILFAVAAFGNLAQWYLATSAGLRLARTLPFLSLHYTVYSGVDWIGPWFYIFLYPLIGTLLGAVNFWLASRVYSRERLLSYILGATAFIGEALLAVFIIFLLSINIQAQ